MSSESVRSLTRELDMRRQRPSQNKDFYSFSEFICRELDMRRLRPKQRARVYLLGKELCLGV